MVHDRGRVIFAEALRGGPVTVEHLDGFADLRALAVGLRAPWAAALDRDALREAMHRYQSRADPRGDEAHHLLLLWRTARELADEGRLLVWPERLARLPVPSEAAVRRAFDLLLPAGRAWVLGAFERGALSTGIVVSRGPSEIELVAGPEWIARVAGPLSGDFRRDWRAILSGVERAGRAPSLGLFGETRDLASLIRGERAGGWAQAVARREVILEPMPMFAAVLIGAGAVEAAARATGGWIRAAGFGGVVDRIGPFTRPLTQSLRSAAVRLTGVRVPSVEDLLGFDPSRWPFALVGSWLRGR